MARSERVHRAMSADGTGIAGHVYGQGPPLVFVHGGIGDEDSWRLLIPFLSERFTCYPLSLRGLGLSAESSDHSVERQVEDVVAFADGIGDPVGLVGHSSGGALALAAAARADRVATVAVYEPTLLELDEEMRSRLQDAFGRMADAAAEGNLVDAAQIMFKEAVPLNDEELAALAAADAAGFVAPNVPVSLRLGDKFVAHNFLEDGLLERLTIPIALLHGSDTHAFFTGVVAHLAGRLPDVRVAEVAAAGHMGPLLAARDVATELARFFEAPRQPT